MTHLPCASIYRHFTPDVRWVLLDTLFQRILSLGSCAEPLTLKTRLLFGRVSGGSVNWTSPICVEATAAKASVLTCFGGQFFHVSAACGIDY